MSFSISKHFEVAFKKELVNGGFSFHIGSEMMIIPQSNGYKGHHTGAM